MAEALPDTPALFAFINDLAACSGEVIRHYFSRPDKVRIESKADASPVTQADREAEETLRAMIRSRFPGHGILGEEGGSERTDARFKWVLDPIDGTESFVHGVPLFGTLIALLEEGRPWIGAIHNPILGETVIGDGAHCQYNGATCRVRGCRELVDATLLTSMPALYNRSPGEGIPAELVQRVRLCRAWGDCHGYLLVATGRADIMLDRGLQEWDRMALIPIITGAGGSITGWDGGDPVTATDLAVSNPSLHPELLDRLAV